MPGSSMGMGLRRLNSSVPPRGMLNVWNAEFYNHLNARTPFGGAQVPEPGRHVFLDAAWSF